MHMQKQLLQGSDILVREELMSEDGGIRKEAIQTRATLHD